MTHHTLNRFTLLAALLAPRVSPAQTVVNEGFYYRSLTLARLNPLGLFTELRTGYRHRLSRSARPILQNTYLGLSATMFNSPAFTRPGIVLEVQPLAALQLFAQWEFTQYYGNFQFLQSFSSPYANHSDTELRARAERGLNQATTEHRITLGATLQARVDTFAARSTLRAVHFSADIPSADRVYYDIFYDMMVPNRGWLLASDTDLLLSIPEMGFNFGLRYSYLSSVFPDASYAPGEARENPNSPSHRVGPILALTFNERRHGWFNAPTLIVMANWYLGHRYRTGDDVSGAVPYVILGFQFRGD